MPRPQFTLRALLVLMLAVACFFGGIRFERERERREGLERERLAFEAERAKLIEEMQATQLRLSESMAGVQESLQAWREMQENAQPSRGGRTSSKLRVIPDVVWEDPGPAAQ